MSHIDSLFANYKIDPARIVYVPPRSEKASKAVVAATQDRVKDFLAHCKIPKDSVVLSDQGDEFAVLDKSAFVKHIVYPPPVHQWLSPNDNRLHGAAKQRWRNLGLDFHDDAEALVSFLKCLDDSMDGVPGWFEANLQVGSKAVSRETVDQLIRGRNHADNRFYRDCRREYRIWTKQDARGEIDARIWGGLDGSYWE